MYMIGHCICFYYFYAFLFTQFSQYLSYIFPLSFHRLLFFYTLVQILCDIDNDMLNVLISLFHFSC